MRRCFVGKLLLLWFFFPLAALLLARENVATPLLWFSVLLHPRGEEETIVLLFFESHPKETRPEETRRLGLYLITQAVFKQCEFLNFAAALDHRVWGDEGSGFWYEKNNARQQVFVGFPAPEIEHQEGLTHSPGLIKWLFGSSPSGLEKEEKLVLFSSIFCFSFDYYPKVVTRRWLF